MNFHWWWILVGLAAIWIIGWIVTATMQLFFNPLDSDEQKPQDLRERLLATSVINLLLWPGMLSAMLDRRRFLRDIQTGKKPSWIVLAKGEEAGREWKLSDGTEFGALVSAGGSASEKCSISADYEDETLTGEIRFRVRMVAPESKPLLDWTPLEFSPRGPQPDPEDEEAVLNYEASRYEKAVKLPRGKRLVEFQVPNRSGKIEECAALTLIVAESDDYEP